MAKISADLKSKWEHNPNATTSVIVMTQNESAEYASLMSPRGITVTRVFTLIHGLALTGLASAMLALANEPWVVSIEEDRPVHTMT